MIEAELTRCVASWCPGATGVTAPAKLSGGASQETWSFDIVHPDGNVGAFSKATKFTILARMVATLSGTPPKGQRAVASVAVVDAKGKPVKGAAVKLRGAGVKTGAHRTNKKGIATFSIKPTKAANLVVTVTKKLYKVATTSIAVS